MGGLLDRTTRQLSRQLTRSVAAGGGTGCPGCWLSIPGPGPAADRDRGVTGWS